MSDKEVAKVLKQNELDAAQVTGVSGAGDCGPTATIGTDGISITSSPDSMGGSIVQVYEGLIEATSYAIERIADSLK